MQFSSFPFSYAFKPACGLRFLDYGQNLNGLPCHVVEDSDIFNSKSVLRLSHTPQPFDAALAYLGWLVAQVQFNGVSNR